MYLKFQRSLCTCLTHLPWADLSSRYKHLGQFAPLGGEQTAAQLPGDWVSIGRSTQWVWYSVYARYAFPRYSWCKKYPYNSKIFVFLGKIIRSRDIGNQTIANKGKPRANQYAKQYISSILLAFDSSPNPLF